MWSLFLIQQLHLSSIARLVVKKGHQNDTCDNDWIVCSKYRHHSRLNSLKHTGKRICVRFKRKKIIGVDSHKFYIFTPILKLEMAIFVMPNTIQWPKFCGVGSAHNKTHTLLATIYSWLHRNNPQDTNGIMQTNVTVSS